jgi:hypothetical protein
MNKSILPLRLSLPFELSQNSRFQNVWFTCSKFRNQMLQTAPFSKEFRFLVSEQWKVEEISRLNGINEIHKGCCFLVLCLPLFNYKNAHCLLGY